MMLEEYLKKINADSMIQIGARSGYVYAGKVDGFRGKNKFLQREVLKIQKSTMGGPHINVIIKGNEAGKKDLKMGPLTAEGIDDTAAMKLISAIYSALIEQLRDAYHLHARNPRDAEAKSMAIRCENEIRFNRYHILNPDSIDYIIRRVKQEERKVRCR